MTPYSTTSLKKNRQKREDGSNGHSRYLRNLNAISEWAVAEKGRSERAFGRILVVNNGLSALRLIQGIKALSLDISCGKDPNLIQIVALASDADWVGDSPEDAVKRPEYLKQFDIEIARLHGTRPADTYQHQENVLGTAKKYQCDALAVGWGHLAENVEFAQKVRDSGLVFIGPTVEAMRAMGDKIMSKLLIQAAGVPLVSWSGNLDNDESGGLLEELRAYLGTKGAEGKISAIDDAFYKNIYDVVGVSTPEEAEKIAREIGYPVVIKATAGGGGRGIRFVQNDRDVKGAFNAARAEARAAFGNDVVFIEKDVGRGCKHVEEQVLGDFHGTVVVLGERECSIQRHHQKVIEEAGDDIPISLETRKRIRKASLDAARTVDYVSAGTVEFLVDGDGNPYFMEMNTRLQVEHIATEALYPGLDLVKEQLKIAMGIPLPPDISNRQSDFRMGGHSICVRLLAENPDAGFSPQSGIIQSMEFPSMGPNTPRCYFSYGAGGLVHSFADSQIGHAVARGRTREEARLHMISYLQDLRFLGILTTRVFSLDILQDPEYIRGGGIHTDWLGERMERIEYMGGSHPERPGLALISMGLIDYSARRAERKNQFFSCLNSGQNIRPTILANTSYTRIRYKGSVHEVYVREVGEDRYHVTMGNMTASVNFRENPPFGGYLLKIGEETLRAYRTDEAVETHIEVGGRTSTFETDLDQSTFRAPLTGTVTEIIVEEGREVNEGEGLLTMEAMKMITMLSSPRKGKVSEVCIKVGDSVDGGTVLIRFEGEAEDEPKGGGSDVSLDPEVGELWHSIAEGRDNIEVREFRDLTPGAALRNILVTMEDIFRGFSIPAFIVEAMIRESHDLKRRVLEEEWLYFISSLTDAFYRDERYFRSGDALLHILEEMRCTDNDADPFDLTRSHALLNIKRDVLIQLFRGLSGMDYRSLGSRFKRLVSLGYNDQYRDIVAKAEELLYLQTSKLEPEQDLEEMMEQILLAGESGDDEAKERLLSSVMESPESLMGRLVGYLLTGRSGLRRLAGKLIILRAYRRHPELSCDYEKSPEGKRTYIWKFRDDESGHFRVGLVSLVEPGNTIGNVVNRLLAKLKTIWRTDKQRPPGGDVIEILIGRPPGIADSNELSSHLADIVNRILGKIKLKRITFVVREKGEDYPGLLTFRPQGPNGEYVEVRLFRDLHPSLGNVLDMDQLEPFMDHLTKMPSSDMNVHLFHYRKPDRRGEDYPEIENRIYVRTMIRNSHIVMTEDGPTFPAAIEAFRASLRHLRISYAATGAKTHNNQIYLRFVHPIKISWSLIKKIILKMRRHIRDYADVDLTRTMIHGLAYSWLSPEKPQEVLIFVDNPTGLMLELKRYVIREHVFQGGETPTRALVPYEELEREMKETGYIPSEDRFRKVSELYRDMDILGRKRQMRRSRGKVYVYDRVTLLEEEAKKIWGVAGKRAPDDFFHARELILDPSGTLVPVKREPGRNRLSMVVWRISIRTPETPEGRDVIAISGDMTLRGGSVAIREDMTYVAASELACDEGIPFIYFAEGSGARIGLDRIVSHRLLYDEESDELYLTPGDHEVLKPLVMAEERGDRFVVSSIIGGVPGIRIDEEGGYLYLNESDYAVHKEFVEAHPIEESAGEEERRRWVIDRIVRSSPEINQENLSGSARMARASSLAFHSVPTMAVVTDTCTGIISYNVRLLKRVIQTRESEIILTGYRALNALYGGEKIFSSNRELGGPGIMGPNGVSHRIVENEREACAHLLEWLRGLPPRIGDCVPVIANPDPVGRDVREDIIGPNAVIQPPEPDAERPHPYDALRLAEVLFDMESTREEMYDWGKTVRVGRATIGGIPIGFIAVETGTAIKKIPADPSDTESFAKNKLQFGQVWYPDSSYKTAQWIEFMCRERKPLVILPNWRGFAGGKSELFEEVLKYGSMIVDELSKYDLPVILYMPPYAEIRGGAWVVIDTQINPGHIRFLVDEHATGSVLEPSGMESVPLVEREIRKDMRSNDELLVRLYNERNRHIGQLERVRDIDRRIDERENETYPDYVKKWIRIFRKHNTAERMKAVGAAYEVVRTGEARERIYHLLKAGLDSTYLSNERDSKKE